MFENFYRKRSKLNIVQLFLVILFRQIKDSPRFYCCLFLISTASYIFSFFVVNWDYPGICEVAKIVVAGSEPLFNLLPPFLLAVLAMFPSFGDSSKRKLMEISVKTGEPRVAPFLDQFIFLIFQSLLLLVFTKIILAFKMFESPSYSTSIFQQLNILFIHLYFFMILALIWESFDAIKSLYVLILRDYFDDK